MKLLFLTLFCLIIATANAQSNYDMTPEQISATSNLITQLVQTSNTLKNSYPTLDILKNTTEDNLKGSIPESMIQASIDYLQSYGIPVDTISSCPPCTYTYNSVININARCVSSAIILLSSELDYNPNAQQIGNQIMGRVCNWHNVLHCILDACGVGSTFQWGVTGIIHAIQGLGVRGTIQAVCTVIADVLPWVTAGIVTWRFLDCMISD